MSVYISNPSRPIMSQHDLDIIINQVLRSSEELAKAMNEFALAHPDSVTAMKMFAKICFYTEKADDESFPVYEEDFFSHCEINKKFYEDRFTKRINNLIDQMHSIPYGIYPVTYNMINLAGKTAANRVFAGCNGLAEYKGVSACTELLDIARDVYLRIYLSDQRCLVPLFLYAIIQLCNYENIISVRDKSFRDKVRTVEIDHKR
ncbi:hypothetical protein TVAGG3_1058440 [Trichomonas vaginalis G3]|uniref:hypothetical protein n=1 Tax=Trichomonas vaginalis (strain ATCC PRA-98 / G3) TaxID=412133 RepID=UPI0021E55ACA|nr:hypothetical protein TVAGG3_1058440 [Trichomonas vaginalis G3]KAI5494576.1 hypothetical protein TVAGG3_1058440 [Trichomonas vaginalis G3]